ncbi:MAG: hypothetical protein K0V04_27660 [Deltaproteobacteria bacterium]|nr:hypothetical protein [Deltaproteobacteria bacterium]
MVPKDAQRSVQQPPLEAGVGQRLDALTVRLGAAGYDVASLQELRLEIEVLERPPGLVKRVTGRARVAAGRHWRNFVGELQESREVMGLLLGRVQGGQLSAEQRDKIRDQLVDLVKVFPAGIIAAANSAFPVPGTGMFTPWILARLDLMPSRWREAHLLRQLELQKQRLLEAGFADEAAQLGGIEDAVELEAARRDAVGADAGLLTHWDANRNGVWDPEERAAYKTELARLRDLAGRLSARKRWFLEDRGQVFGALRLSEVLDDDDLAEHLGDDGLLVCFDGKTGWVALPDLLGRAPRFS